MKLNRSFRIICILMIIFLLAACKADQQPTPAPTTAQTATEIATEAPEPTATSDEFVEIPDGDKISEIQGAGHISPYEGLEVQNVFGIVTVKRADGFYMQDSNPDSDIATSEGIFVLTRRIPKVERGDAVLVNGKVDEFNPAGAGANSLTITQITLPEYEVLSTGNAIPGATIIGIGGRTQPTEVIENDVDGSAASTGVFDPEEDGLDFYESMESMLIQLNDAVAVSSTSKYKEIAVVPDRGANAGVLSVRGGIILQENDQNPERIILDDTFLMLPSVQVGDIFIEPIIGVLDYTYGNFKLQPIVKPQFESAGLEEELPAPEISEMQIAIATYNVENLDAEDNPKRLEKLAHHIVDLMRSPDIIGLQEIQDNDGMLDTESTAADQTYQLIIDAISVAGGPEYHFLDISPVRHTDGGAPGGNIRVGILYRTDRGLTFNGGTPGDAETAVKIINSGGNPSLSLNPGRIDPQNLAFFDSRKPLVAEFTFNGQKQNPNPVVHVFDFNLKAIGLTSVPNVEYRVTDATRVDAEGYFWVMNYFYPGDKHLKPEIDPIAAMYGEGPSHLESETVERLLKLHVSEAGIVLIDQAPIQCFLYPLFIKRNSMNSQRLTSRILNIRKDICFLYVEKAA